MLALGTLAGVALILTRNIWGNGAFATGVDPPDYIMRLRLLGGESFSWYFASWYPFKALGHIYLNLSLFDLLTQVFASLNAVLAWKLVYYAAMPLFAGAGMFLFLRRQSLSVGSAWAGSLFYLLNPYYLNYLIIGALFEVAYYSMAPFLLYFWSRVLEERRFSSILPASILTAFYLTSISPYVQLSFLPFILGYVVIAIMWSSDKRSKILNCLLVLVPAAALSLPFALNILAYANATSFFGNPFFSNPTIVAAYSYHNILGALLLIYPVFIKGSFLYFFTGQDPWYHVTSPPWAIDIIAPLVLLSMLSPYLARNFMPKRWIYYFFSASLLSIYVSTGPNPPAPALFTLLYKNIPLFSSLRSFLRYGAITAFSFSFLIAISLEAIIPVLPRLNLSVRIPFRPLAFKMGVSAFLLYLGIAAILLGGAVGNFNLAYPTAVSPPPSYTQPFQYLSNQYSSTSGPFRAVVIPFYWQDLTPSWAGRTADFGGYFGSVISGVSAVQYSTIDLEAAPNSLLLLSYLRQLELSNATDRWAMLTGELTNSKYVVVQTYSSQWERNFITNQTGLSPTAQGDNWTVYRDAYFQPFVTASNNGMLVFGGLSSLLGLTFVNGSNNFAKFFATQMNPSSINSILSWKNTSMLVYNTDLSDFEMYYGANLVDYTFPLWRFAPDSQGPNFDWTRSLNATSQGLLTYNSFTATTSTNQQLNVPFNCSANCTSPRLIMLRAEFAPRAGSVMLTLNGVNLANVSLQSDEPTFKWITFPSVSLLPGKNIITLQDTNNEIIDLDQLSIATSSELELLSSAVARLSTSYAFNYINSVDALQWSSTVPAGCNRGLDLETRSGAYVQVCLIPTILSRNITVPKDGAYKISVRGKGVFQISLQIEGQQLKWVHSSSSWMDSQSPEFHLTGGTHAAQLQISNASSPSNAVYSNLDSVTLFSLPAFTGLSQPSPTVGVISRVDPGHYRVDLDLPQGSLVLFHESYNSYWVLRIGGMQIAPIDESSAFNAYRLPVAVNGTADLYFTYRDRVAFDWTIAFQAFWIIMLFELVFIHRQTLTRYLLKRPAQEQPSSGMAKCG